MGSDTFYNERRFPWGVIRFVWAVTGIRTAPPVRAEKGAGSACRADQSAFMRAYRIRGARRFLWAVGTSYNEQALLRKVVRLV